MLSFQIVFGVAHLENPNSKYWSSDTDHMCWWKKKTQLLKSLGRLSVYLHLWVDGPVCLYDSICTFIQLGIWHPPLLIITWRKDYLPFSLSSVTNSLRNSSLFIYSVSHFWLEKINSVFGILISKCGKEILMKDCCGMLSVLQNFTYLIGLKTSST